MSNWLRDLSDNPYNCQDHTFTYLREDKRICNQCGLEQYLKWCNDYREKRWFTLEGG